MYSRRDSRASSFRSSGVCGWVLGTLWRCQHRVHTALHCIAPTCAVPCWLAADCCRLVADKNHTFPGRYEVQQIGAQQG